MLEEVCWRSPLATDAHIWAHASHIPHHKSKGHSRSSLLTQGIQGQLVLREEREDWSGQHSQIRVDEAVARCWLVTTCTGILGPRAPWNKGL